MNGNMLVKKLIYKVIITIEEFFDFVLEGKKFRMFGDISIKLIPDFYASM